MSKGSLSQWLNSDFFVVFVVVLVLLLLVIFAVCWVIRHHQKQRTTEKMAEIEIIPVDGSDRGNIPRFTLKIVTEQSHATELVEMLTHKGHSIKVQDHHSNPSVSAVTADSDNDKDYSDAIEHL